MSESPHSKKLRHWVDPNSSRHGYSFWCPGCRGYHSLTTSPGGWGFNGNKDAPTFTPSILTKGGHYADHHKQGDTCWCTFYKEEKHKDDPIKFECSICHSFVTDGMIQFLGDCTHALAGQTVELPDYPVS